VCCICLLLLLRLVRRLLLLVLRLVLLLLLPRATGGEPLRYRRGGGVSVTARPPSLKRTRTILILG